MLKGLSEVTRKQEMNQNRGNCSFLYVVNNSARFVRLVDVGKCNCQAAVLID